MVAAYKSAEGCVSSDFNSSDPTIFERPALTDDVLAPGLCVAQRAIEPALLCINRAAADGIKEQPDNLSRRLAHVDVRQPQVRALSFGRLLVLLKPFPMPLDR